MPETAAGYNKRLGAECTVDLDFGVSSCATKQVSALMPCRYVIDAEHGLVISTAWDRITFAEVDAHQNKLASDPAFNPDFKQLVDATKVTDLDISISEAKAIFGRKTFSSSSHCAFLGKGLVILGMGRLIEAQAAMTEGREKVRVFSDRKSALKWLGIEPVS
jgi:hypothetical protein